LNGSSVTSLAAWDTVNATWKSFGKKKEKRKKRKEKKKEKKEKKEKKKEKKRGAAQDAQITRFCVISVTPAPEGR
jgi:hypothetical protein